MFSDIFPISLAGPAHGMPALDVYTEDDKALVTEVQVPGFDKDDISVNIQDGVLEIKGEKHEKAEDKKSKRSYMKRESHASFYRSLVLPKNANADKIDAHFDNGVLTVTVPFKALPKPKKISISAGKKK
jgi:HSP20 family protein